MLERKVEINGCEIKVQQNLGFSHAGTVWDGALVLAHYLQKNKDVSQELITGKNILELGSGTGISGLSTIPFQPRKLYLTDLPGFIPFLQGNCDMNTQAIKKNNCEVVARPLAWDEQQYYSGIDCKIDTIIGSQLTYDPSLVTRLINTFKHFKKINPEMNILISYQKYENKGKNLLNRLVEDELLSGRLTEINEEDMDADCRDDYIGILRIK